MLSVPQCTVLRHNNSSASARRHSRIKLVLVTLFLLSFPESNASETSPPCTSLAWTLFSLFPIAGEDYSLFHMQWAGQPWWAVQKTGKTPHQHRGAGPAPGWAGKTCSGAGAGAGTDQTGTGWIRVQDTGLDAPAELCHWRDPGIQKHMASENADFDTRSVAKQKREGEGREERKGSQGIVWWGGDETFEVTRKW